MRLMFLAQLCVTRSRERLLLRNTSKCTQPTAEILSGKNVRAWGSMDFTQDKFSAPIAIEKIKILGAPWELPA